MARADELFSELERDGLAIRYELPRQGGRVMALLCHTDGSIVRALSMTEALGLADPPAAA
jgi:hypothetical protein